MHFSKPAKQRNKKYKNLDTSEYIEFTSQQFIELAKIQCTLTEICHFFHITMNELDKNCKREFGVPAQYALKEYSDGGKISLRRSQFKTAVEKDNPIMQIWLGKNYLNQCEDPAKRVQDEQKQETLTSILEAVKKI